MAYIGVSPSNGVRRVHTYTATASQTTFSGAGAEGTSLSYKDSNFVDVYQNGIKLCDADYTSTSGTSIVLAQGASVSDLVVVVVFDVFSVADTVSKADGGTFDGAVSFGGNITDSGDLTLDVAGDITLDAGGGDVNIADDGTTIGVIANDGSSNFVVKSSVQDKDIIFKGNDGGSTIEAMRIDMSAGGTLLIGKTTNTSNVSGIELEASGTIALNRASNTAMFINRTSDTGDYIEFRKDNGTRGNIGTVGTFLYIGTGDVGVYFHNDSDSIIPCDPSNDGANRDDAIDLGHPSVRFDDVRATNGTIQTSDRNEKQDIEELSDAEKRVAVVAKGLMRKFRWKSKVAIKGDKARTHFGIIAQDLEDAFKAEGLDASKYAMFCSDTWWEKEISVDAVEADEEKGIEAKDAYTYMDFKEEATEGYTEKTRLGVRYSELLAFIISAI